MRKRFEAIRCSQCPYEALGAPDLAAHTKFAHPGGSAAPVAPPPPDPAPSAPPPAAAPVAAPAPLASALAPADVLSSIDSAADAESPEPAADAPAADVLASESEPADIPEDAPVPEDAPAADAPKHHPAIVVPAADPTFWVPDEIPQLWHANERDREAGAIVNYGLRGPKGTGKTSLPREYAAAYGLPFHKVECALITEPGDWWGSKELDVKRGTFFRTAAFLHAVETPGCVVLLDEANRTHPENLNSLFGLLDDNRRAWVPQLGREVRVAPGVTFFLTLNEGFQYVGVNPVDAALADRVNFWIGMKYPPKDTEVSLMVARTGVGQALAEQLGELAQTVRRNPKIGATISTRQLLRTARLVTGGLPLNMAVMFGIVNGLGDDVDRTALLQALQIIGGIDAAWVEGNQQFVGGVH